MKLLPIESAPKATGIEALVCQDIAGRQEVGIAKYGQTLDETNADLAARLTHAYQESLDLPIYLKWAISEAESLTAELQAVKAERDSLRVALESMILGACGVGVRHPAEHMLLQECVEIGRRALKGGAS